MPSKFTEEDRHIKLLEKMLVGFYESFPFWVEGSKYYDEVTSFSIIYLTNNIECVWWIDILSTNGTPFPRILFIV